MSVSQAIFVYILGGVTFIPIVLSIMVVFYFFHYGNTIDVSIPEKESVQSSVYAQRGKKGWIRLTNRYKSSVSSELSNVAVLMSGIQSYVQGSRRHKELVYAELKSGALFIYESNSQEDCKIIIPVHNYHVSIHPEKCQDNDTFKKSVALRLIPKNADNDNMVLLNSSVDEPTTPYLTSTNELFINCTISTDKEDWYFALLAASNMMTETPDSVHMEMIDSTHFDTSAMQSLISTVYCNAEYREMQWLNAIAGRLFLGMYKTDEMKLYLQNKVTKKVERVKRPSFLGEIIVRSVDIGNSIPFITQPKLLSLTPEGDLIAEARIHYTGGLRVVIQTDFNWTYSSLMKPIRVPLVIAVTLKKVSGRVQFRVKPPPTNRCWIGFYKLPEMDWEISPIVSDKQIRLSMVINAIRSKISEFILESMVLPNMDDFPFSDSDGKGGIFGERVPRPSTPVESASSSMASLPDFTYMGSPSPIKSCVDPFSFQQKPAKLIPPVKLANRRADSDGVLLENAHHAESSSLLVDTHILSRARGYSSPGDIPLESFHKIPDGELETNSSAEICVNSTAISESDKPISPTIAIGLDDQPSPPIATEFIPNSCYEKELKSMMEPPTIPLIETDHEMYSIIHPDDTSRKSKTTILTKIGNKTKHKAAFYNMAGNIFRKSKNHVSKELKEERNRELEASHNRKMMSLFVSPPQEQNPPPLPPRKTERPPLCSSLSSNDNSSGSSDELDTPSIKYHDSVHEKQPFMATLS
ncbi:putative integral membrane protein conserved region-domain-containing protein [Pilobolus umbonatus]|nr:putative integral membrane protein conserved region-domain-containing protein [Pilobolus umbonatus]